MSHVFQSAYKQFHFTETALLKVHNDISINMDTRKVTALTLSDLPVAFDTVDYSVLLYRVSDWYGTSGTAFTWIRSFLVNRFESIKIRNCFSKAGPLFCGVSQGSVLRPLLFTLYITPLSSLTALITSRLDYCNYLLYNIAPKDILKLQCVQNCLPRVVSQSPRFSHSVPLLKSLHWLPLQILCTIGYQTLSSGEPSYLFSILSLAPKSRELHLLSIPRVKTHTGTLAFSVAVPTLWNSLSEHVKSSNSMVSFHHHLKSHLFRFAYPS